MTGNRLLALAAAATFACGAAAAAASAASLAAPPGVERKLDARLLARALASPDELVSAWVEFADKGERDPADLARRLAAAERALSPRSRARRLKAGVTPLVDALDLPVEPAYLAQLRAAGLEPYAVSRWFNRAAVHVRAGELTRLAALGSVARLAPVEKAFVSRDPVGDAAPLERSRQTLAGGLAPGERATLVDYGNSAAQLAQINVPAVHDSGYIGQGVLICMLDDGFYYQDQHDATKVIDVPPGFRRDFVDGDTVLTDPTAGTHGLWTLSVIGANKPGSLVGCAFGATYALARTEVDASETPREMTNWMLGAEWADSLGADVISSSLGYFTFDGGVGNYTYADLNGHTTVVTRAAEIAAAKGILVVNAAGNGGYSGYRTLIAPADANGDSVVTSGAVDASGIIAGFSSRGPTADGRLKPDLCARGVADAMVSTAGPSAYTTNNGTSFSTPLTAGVCALIISARPSWRPQTVIQALRLTASRTSTPDSTYGWGIINALAALQVPASVLGVPDAGVRPFGIALLGSNPLRSGATARLRLQLDVATAEPASVRVVDVTGRTVRTLWSGAAGGAIDVAWDGRDRAGRRVQPGVYWVALARGARTASVRLVAL